MAARNVRCRGDEVDLIVIVDGIPVIVEVKTGTADTGIDPAQSFDDRKARALRRAGRRLDPPIDRIDLVTVRLDREGADVRWITHVA